MQSAMYVVVVESPAKAKTITKYLGKDFRVLASYGHVRDLPAKNGSVDPDRNFAMVWQVDARGDKQIRAIAAAVKGAERLYLATDPDREGEAISWHIAEELARRDALDGVEVKRVVFNEVTKRAVTEAFDRPRELNKELIEAYLARRALDYLVGFTLSPVLWRKLPGSRSAGRVQSVALRLICEREAELEIFRAREYWTVDARLSGPSEEPFKARLTHLKGRKLGKFDLGDESAAGAAALVLEQARDFTVGAVERKTVRRNPQPAFTTSTLQQEASHKLGFGATRTMRTAQRLYEGIELDGETVGLITYMRTDSVQVSSEAIESARSLIETKFGGSYVPAAPPVYKTKAKNAQEAHEAIRPTDLFRRPEDVARRLASDERKLYGLIWTRMLASQMESARLDQVRVDIAAQGGQAGLRATGTVVLFDGFLTLYQEGGDESRDNAAEDREAERHLPELLEGDRLIRLEVVPDQHFTQPPPRYGEASLVKKLEELGIGRPSTYASILQVLQDRDYVRLEKRRFVPEDRGRLVTAFLTSFFERYVQYNFTADLETQLDDISGGRKAWQAVLGQFWDAFAKKISETKDLSISNVIDALDRDLGPHFFPVNPDAPEKDPRACPTCGGGRLGLKLGRSGGFIGCSNYPNCRYTRPLAVPNGGEDGAGAEFAGPRELGADPETGEIVTLRKGPYGLYVQRGEPTGPKGKNKPPRASLPKGFAPEDVSLNKALALLALPRTVGAHPDTGQPITAGIGRYGPYVKHEATYRNIPDGEDVLIIGLNRAVALIAEAPARRGSNAGKQIGPHPSDGKPVTLHSGRYGPYVKHGRTIASLPKGESEDEISFERAVDLLAAKAAKGKPKAKTSARSKKAARKTAKRKSEPRTTAN